MFVVLHFVLIETVLGLSGQFWARGASDVVSGLEELETKEEFDAAVSTLRSTLHAKARLFVAFNKAVLHKFDCGFWGGAVNYRKHEKPNPDKDAPYGCNMTQGQSWLSLGTLGVLVILFGTILNNLHI